MSGRIERHGPRKRLSPALVALLTLLTLGGCTGTQEESVPILLIVGSAGTGGSQLQLFEDVFDPLASPARDLVPVPGSIVPLPAPPVSLDVVDRNGARSELVVLDGDGRVHFFDLTELPDAFAPSRSPIDVAALLPTEITAGSPVCLTEVQVGGTADQPGRYAALLDLCPDEDIAEVYVVDLASQDFLYSVSAEHPGVRPLPAGIYLDQERDLLFFATADIADTLVQSLPIDGSAGPQAVGLADIDVEVAGEQDLAPMSGGIGLLADDQLALVPFTGNPDAVQSPVGTELGAAERLLPDPSGNLEMLVAFSSTRGSILDGLEDEDPEPLFLEAPLADATLEPVQLFAYLLEEGGVEILDLFPYAEPPANRLFFIEIPGLDDPRVITWAFGAQDPGLP